MPTEVKRKQGESFDAMYRRFIRRMQQGGLIREVRRRRFRDDPKNRNARRASKVRGMTIGDKRAWLIKTGKATEADFRKRRRRRR